MQQNEDIREPLDPTGGASAASNETSEAAPDPDLAEAAAAEAHAAPSFEDELQALEQKAAEYHEAFLRAKAETDNVRRRAQEDVAKATKFAIEKFAAELLPVKDGLEQTLAVEKATPETLREGVELTLRNLAKAFEKGGLEEIDPTGDKFDPHKHQAMSSVPSDQPANTVVQVFQKGYLLGGRVLRPALVSVSGGNAGS